MTPVSYTHLDVYKRQAGGMAFSGRKYDFQGTGTIIQYRFINEKGQRDPRIYSVQMVHNGAED